MHRASCGDGPSSSTTGLGSVQRHIGGLIQRFDRSSVTWIKGDPGGKSQIIALYTFRQLTQAVCKRLDVHNSRRPPTKLISTQPRHGIICTSQRPRHGGELLKGGIPGGVPVLVVQRLEPIQVDEHEQASGCPWANVSGDTLPESAPVQQSRERIGER